MANLSTIGNTAGPNAKCETIHGSTLQECQEVVGLVSSQNGQQGTCNSKVLLQESQHDLHQLLPATVACNSWGDRQERLSSGIAYR